MSDERTVTLDRLEDQIKWYDHKSLSAQRHYKLLKLLQMVTAAVIPLLAILSVEQWQKVNATLGLCVLILEGVQQLNQYQHNWITYRSTCESLKHEKYTYLASAGPYAGAEDRLATLADRIEGLISQEHAKWVSTQEQMRSPRGLDTAG
ncbi:DUF4231 domain-containing protein [Burkholderia ubonensis]|uniref:DUF4231 domain-containing protein n=1 Tax=Burkholderia ubonensis subsp. mesacidophila TaxID=265293 RepID=A0A2A4ERQ1_9BURK|nr:DUF4231 domain-containing protein [Burkholderia ubonensis]PCE24303.1 hypothetical protein BZL54_33935 [Burkholderia ubonensis subsp. mesacidophila]